MARSANRPSKWEIIGIQLAIAAQRRLHSSHSPKKSCFQQTFPDFASSQSNQHVVKYLYTSAWSESQPKSVSHRPSHTPLALKVIYPALCSLMLPLSCFALSSLLFYLHLSLINGVWLPMPCEGVATLLQEKLPFSPQKSHKPSARGQTFLNA